MLIVTYSDAYRPKYHPRQQHHGWYVRVTSHLKSRIIHGPTTKRGVDNYLAKVRKCLGVAYV